ncbi:flagellar basal body-associated protein FliL [Alteromonas sediminis]|uniref:Flagellar protein FliL n=1 Tax=Alteromonas sediminis TaxID=2259342 RepID=A0A3N5Z8P9_9ALTE|nr:flagellar basal body-associated protein FliL [Alteromonas sediminis]RPJ65448.1 flagellar basal body-associated protein FliL [Alteromonas sediminis]
MIKPWLLRLSFLALFFSHSSAFAQGDFAYLSLEPEIVTNYAGNSARNLGYVRVNIELMLHDIGQLEIAEHHLPLIRATTIEIFGRQPQDKVKSLTGREDIRLTIRKALQDLMQQETGSEIVKDVIFTKYLYQG